MLWIAAAVVVVGLIIVEHFPQGAARPRHPSAHGKVRPVAGSSFQTRVEIPAMPWAASARLPRTGSRPEWFWPAGKRSAVILGLSQGRSGYAFTRVTGGWAIQPDPPGPAVCGNCSGPPRPVFFLADRAQQARLVGSANLVAPAATAGTMWLTSYPPESDLSRTSGVAQEYTSAGTAVGPAIRLPAGYGITEGTSRGLLLVSLSLRGQANSDRLWYPATRTVRGFFDGVVAVSATQVAFEPPCQASCPVHVVNLRTGRDTVIRLPATDTVTTARFSPDDMFLALQVSAGASRHASAMQIGVASLPAGRLAVMPATSASSDALAEFGWLGNRDDLVAEFSFASRVQLLLWDPRAGSLALTDVGPLDSATALVVG
jgi:hypothetical protein